MALKACPQSQIKQLVSYFKDRKAKCYSLKQSFLNHSIDLSKFDQTEAAIASKIQDLSEENIIDCKTTMTRGKGQTYKAIDELLEIQSRLSLQKIRAQERIVCPIRLNSDPETESTQFSTPQKLQKTGITDRLSTTLKSEKITKLINDFKHNQLVNNWQSGKKTESCGDALDRLNKVLLNLNCKVKGIIKDEKGETNKIRLYMLPEFCKILEELERYKMLTEELMIRNQLLKDELLKVKAEVFVSKYRPRYYKPGLRQFGCGTSEEITEIKSQQQYVQRSISLAPATRFEPLNIKWTDFMQNIKASVQNLQKKTQKTNIQEDQKDSANQSLLLDFDEASKLTYSDSSSEKSKNTMRSYQTCKETDIQENHKIAQLKEKIMKYRIPK